MTGWNLPPGCTQADIDRAMGGDDPQCDFCGAVVRENDIGEITWAGKKRLICAKCDEEMDPK